MAVELFDSQGLRFVLATELGSGGEAEVFAVQGRPELVAKVYHEPMPAGRADKIRGMAALRNDRLLGIGAWPVDLLLERAGGSAVGLLMPRVEGFKPIHTLYGPSSRQTEFPRASFHFLVHVAANVARAFSVIHENGHVVGDVNHDNIQVAPNGTTKFIDCDSFQVRANGSWYLCEVGVSTHQPPEMLALGSFRGVTREPNHDNFGLAVLIFQLLMMGRHPFAGTYLGRGDMPIETAIKEHRYAYGPGAASRRMRPPPYTLEPGALSARVSALFEGAFLADRAAGQFRPTAREWVEALGEFARGLRGCDVNSAHNYLRSLADCPLCAIEDRTGAQLFAAIAVIGANKVAFDSTRVWAEIVRQRAPTPLPALPDPFSITAQPKPEYIGLGRQRLAQFNVGVVLLVVAFATLSLPPGRPWLSLGLSLAACALVAIGRSKPREVVRALREAERRWSDIAAKWQAEESDRAFERVFGQLEQARRRLQSLPVVRKAQLDQLGKEGRKPALRRYLENYRVVAGRTLSVSASLKATLQSYGIETAADIEESAIRAIPGLSAEAIHSLFAWRRRIERDFTFDQSKGIEPADIAALDNRIAVEAYRLERLLRGGPARLRAEAEAARARRDELARDAPQALVALAQARADWAAC